MWNGPVPPETIEPTRKQIEEYLEAVRNRARVLQMDVAAPKSELDEVEHLVALLEFSLRDLDRSRAA